MNDLFFRVDEVMEIASWISFEILGMLFSSELSLLYKVFIRLDISLGVVGEIKKMYLCWEPLDNLKSTFLLEQYFFVDLDLLM